MPAAKMVADSTQSDAALEQKKRRHDDKDYPRKNKRDDSSSRSSKHSRTTHRNSSRRTAGSHSEKSSQKKEDSDNNSDMDLSKPLKPISSYVKNRNEMLDQMFDCIRGNTLKRAIPDELQSMNYQELKQRCLAQLEVMSKKRILRILTGDDPANISSSGTEESGDDLENTDKKITINRHKSTKPCSTAESHPADSTSSSSSSTQRTKSSNLALVNLSSDGHLLPQPVTMPNLDNHSLNIQVSGYSLQTMGTGVSTSCPESHTAGSHWLQQPDQSSVISLPAEAGQLQSGQHISTHLLPPYRHTLEMDCSDFPINIAPAQTRKGKNISILSSSSQPHHPHLHPKTQQRNAASSVRPFACSGSGFCICGRCSAPALLSQASVTASLGVAATNMIAACPDTHTPAIPGGAIPGKEQVVPARILARTQMEILELEMRARAIKAMLQAASQCRPLQQQQPQPPPSL